jgi:hypothetical protein
MAGRICIRESIFARWGIFQSFYGYSKQGLRSALASGAAPRQTICHSNCLVRISSRIVLARREWVRSSKRSRHSLKFGDLKCGEMKSLQVNHNWTDWLELRDWPSVKRLTGPTSQPLCLGDAVDERMRRKCAETMRRVAEHMPSLPAAAEIP